MGRSNINSTESKLALFHCIVGGIVKHSLTIRNGARPFGVEVVLMGRSNINSTESKLALFHCTVGGIVNANVYYIETILKC